MSKACWAVICNDAASAPRTATVLAAHLEHIKTCPIAIVTAGPLLSADGKAPVGSLLVFEDAEQETVDAFVRSAPFAVHGIWAEVRIERFAPALSSRREPQA